jgi:hypothetical protein
MIGQKIATRANADVISPKKTIVRNMRPFISDLGRERKARGVKEIGVPLPFKCGGRRSARNTQVNTSR